MDHNLKAQAIYPTGKVHRNQPVDFLVAEAVKAKGGCPE